MAFHYTHVTGRLRRKRSISFHVTRPPTTLPRQAVSGYSTGWAVAAASPLRCRKTRRRRTDGGSIFEYHVEAIATNQCGETTNFVFTHTYIHARNGFWRCLFFAKPPNVRSTVHPESMLPERAPERELQRAVFVNELVSCSEPETSCRKQFQLEDPVSPRSCAAHHVWSAEERRFEFIFRSRDCCFSDSGIWCAVRRLLPSHTRADEERSRCFPALECTCSRFDRTRVPVSDCVA